jgi:hypothetical protein
MRTAQHKFPLSDNKIVSSVKEWFVYLRSDTGKLDFIRCSEPERLPTRENVWVMACLPVPRVSIVQRTTSNGWSLNPEMRGK